MSDESSRLTTPYQRLQKSIQYTERKTHEEASKRENPWGVYRSDHVGIANTLELIPWKLKIL